MIPFGFLASLYHLHSNLTVSQSVEARSTNSEDVQVAVREKRRAENQNPEEAKHEAQKLPANEQQVRQPFASSRLPSPTDKVVELNTTSSPTPAPKPTTSPTSTSTSFSTASFQQLLHTKVDLKTDKNNKTPPKPIPLAESYTNAKKTDTFHTQPTISFEAVLAILFKPRESLEKLPHDFKHEIDLDALVIMSSGLSTPFPSSSSADSIPSQPYDGHLQIYKLMQKELSKVSEPTEKKCKIISATNCTNQFKPIHLMQDNNLNHNNFTMLIHQSAIDQFPLVAFLATQHPESKTLWIEENHDVQKVSKHNWLTNNVAQIYPPVYVY